MNRRVFLASAAVFAAAPLSFAVRPARARTPGLASGTFSASAFQAYVGQAFDVAAGPGQRTIGRLSLQGVEVLPSAPTTEQFSVTFLGTLRPPGGSEGIYEFRNATTGNFQLRIEPGATKQYVARFNLLRQGRLAEPAAPAAPSPTASPTTPPTATPPTATPTPPPSGPAPATNPRGR